MKQGFTLVELLLFLALFSALTVILSSIFMTALETQLSVGTRTSLDLQRDFIERRILYDLRNSSSVSTPSQYDTSGQVLELTIDGVSHVYSLINNRLVLAKGGESQFLTDDSISVSSFDVQLQGESADNPIVTVAIVFEGAVGYNAITTVPLDISVHIR